LLTIRLDCELWAFTAENVERLSSVISTDRVEIKAALKLHGTNVCGNAPRGHGWINAYAYVFSFFPLSLPPRPAPGVFTRSFRAGKLAGLRVHGSAGIKNACFSSMAACELAVRVAKVRRFRGRSFFSIKAPESLVPSLTDLHLFEPRPSKRRSDEKLDAETGFAGIGA